MPRKPWLTVTGVRYFLHPTKLRWSRKENLRESTRGWIYSQTRSTGPNSQLPCILDRQRRLPKTLRDHVRSASALSALKESLVANLSAKRQLSFAKLSAKRIFSLAKRDFLVANGRMAADFSSPGSAPQNGDGPAEADFAVMRVCA